MSIELYKIANAQTSLICEGIFGSKSEDGKIYNKVELTMILRDEKNKAVETLRYYLDVPCAKVIFHDIWEGTFVEEYNEFKKSATAERALNIQPGERGYKVSILNVKEDGEKRRLYFILSKFQARQLAISVLDHIKVHELSSAICEKLRGKGESV